MRFVETGEAFKMTTTVATKIVTKIAAMGCVIGFGALGGCMTVVGPTEQAQPLPPVAINDNTPVVNTPPPPVKVPNEHLENTSMDGARVMRAPTDEVAAYPTAALAAPSNKQRPALSGALKKLLLRAQQEQRQGEYAAALSTLDRAARMDPRNGEVYLAMAKVRWSQNKFALAQQLAEKALSFARGFEALQEEARALITRVSQ